MVEAERGHRKNRDTLFVNQEGVFVRAVHRAAILDDTQPARRKLLNDAMIEQDNAVGDVFLHSLSRERALAALGGDDGRDPLILEPAKQAAQFRAQDGGVAEAAEERFERVEHDPLRAMELMA